MPLEEQVHWSRRALNYSPSRSPSSSRLYGPTASQRQRSLPSAKKPPEPLRRAVADSLSASSSNLQASSSAPSTEASRTLRVRSCFGSVAVIFEFGQIVLYLGVKTLNLASNGFVCLHLARISNLKSPRFVKDELLVSRFIFVWATEVLTTNLSSYMQMSTVLSYEEYKHGY